MRIKNKRIPFLMTLFSLLMMFYGYLTKYNPKYGDVLPSNHIMQTNSEKIGFIGLEIPYIDFTLFMVIMFGIGVYLLYFSKDDSLSDIYFHVREFCKKIGENLQRVKKNF